MKRSTKAERWFDEGVQHYQVGNPQKALAAFGKAEAFLRALITDNQPQYRPDLAGTRMNEGSALNALNCPEEALARYEAAASIYQGLIDGGLARYRPNLALTRMNEGVARLVRTHPGLAQPLVFPLDSLALSLERRPAVVVRASASWISRPRWSRENNCIGSRVACCSTMPA